MEGNSKTTEGLCPSLNKHPQGTDPHWHRATCTQVSTRGSDRGYDRAHRGVMETCTEVSTQGFGGDLHSGEHTESYDTRLWRLC